MPKPNAAGGSLAVWQQLRLQLQFGVAVGVLDTDMDMGTDTGTHPSWTCGALVRHIQMWS